MEIEELKQRLREINYMHTGDLGEKAADALSQLQAENAELRRELEEARKLEAAFNPRRWTQAMSDAWHLNIPDTQKAFETLLDAARQQHG